MSKYALIIIVVSIMWSCNQQPKTAIHLPSKNYHYTELDLASLHRQEKVYVPIYSDIYHSSDARRFLLTATLSIRNTSLRDSMYVAKVDYYDSQGNLNRAYLQQTILLKPLESVEFVVEHKEDEGGAGANFIVHWGTNSADIQPIIQAVMIGTASQQGISFVTEGLVIEKYQKQDSSTILD
ncbi:MAG: DUF3124 domain-containing protein [Saprospiraceae bacterium]|nr:DUF3124 domain-containing protein [Saprospiraceae bacterium]